MACDLTLPTERPVTGPVENASAVGVPVGVVAVGTGVEAGTPVIAVEAAPGRVPRGTSDRLQLVHAAQQPSVVLGGTVVVQLGAADAGTQAEKIKNIRQVRRLLQNRVFTLKTL